MRLLVAVTAAMLAGCANTSYDKIGGSQAGFDRDVAQCRYEASKAAAGYGTSETRRSASGAAGPGFGEGIAQAMDKRDLVHECLLARGYHVKR